MFFHFRAWVPRVLSENLWPQFEQSTYLESHLPAWWTDAASMDSCIPLPTTSTLFSDAFQSQSHKITAITLLIDSAIQGLTATVQASAPGGRKDAKLTLQYMNEIANISAKVCGTQSHPEVELSLGVGSSCMSICGITLLDSHTKCARTTKAGIGYQNENWSTAVLYGPMAGRCVDTYLSNVLSPELQVALPIFVIILISNVALRSLGDHITGTINQQFKWWITSHGLTAGLLQHTPNTQTMFGLFTEVNLKNLWGKPQIGVSMSLKA